MKLNGNVDALVFAGGIGEQGKELREAVGRGVLCLGFKEIEGSRNATERVKGGGVVVDVGGAGENGAEGKRILVCKTDEQLEMARQCALENEFWD